MSLTETSPTAPSGTPPFAPFERLIARRYLRARRKEGFISVIAGFSFIGILLGVAALITVLAVMNGFRKELLDRIIGVNGHMFVHPSDRPLTDYDAVAARLAAVPGVKLAFPLVEGQAFATVPGRGSGVLVRGVREADLKRIDFIAKTIRLGTLDDFDKGKDGRIGIALGRRLADNLGVTLGDFVSLLAPDGPDTPFGPTPRRKIYEILAIFEIGMSNYDELFVFMPLAEAQAYFKRDDDVQLVELFVADPDRVQDLRPAVEAAMGRPGIVSDWRFRNRSFFSALIVERNVMFVILSLIVLVAALNIVSGLIMLVKDKSTDIAILRTMGATRGAMMRIFLMTGASIGVVGTLAGLAVGLALTFSLTTIVRGVSRLTGVDLWDPTVRFLSEVPTVVHWGEVVAVVAMSLTLSVLATLYPAWRAARLDPVEVMRYG